MLTFDTNFWGAVRVLQASLPLLPTSGNAVASIDNASFATDTITVCVTTACLSVCTCSSPQPHCLHVAYLQQKEKLLKPKKTRPDPCTYTQSAFLSKTCVHFAQHVGSADIKHFGIARRICKNSCDHLCRVTDCCTWLPAIHCLQVGPHGPAGGVVLQPRLHQQPHQH
jgi:hypothetical protein